LGDVLGYVTSVYDTMTGAATDAIDEAKRMVEAEKAAEVLGDALDHVASVSFDDVKQAANETKDAIKAAFSDPVPTIQQLQAEEERLASQRRRAMREGRFDIVAMIDARSGEIAQQIANRQTVNAHYRAEKQEQKDRRADVKLLREEFGVSKEVAHQLHTKLVATFGQKWRTQVDYGPLAKALVLAQNLASVLGSKTVQDAINGNIANIKGDERKGNASPKKEPPLPKPRGPGRAAGGPVSAGGAYLVGERGPEVLTMGSASGNITPNHRLGGSGGNVYLDGHLVGKVLDDYMGRQYGTASRVSNYRRSN
ncbi:MAG TPA: hypothetical protein VMW94_10620, partial [Actinomycetes bacterium]|nr:hypothetical protein [Actinomycetes bacterium]